MKEYSICPFEETVETVVLSGQWTPGLSAHVRACPACQDTVCIREYLQSAADESGLQPVLPTASYIWYKAQLLGKRETERLVTRWMIVLRSMAYLAFSAAIVGWTLYNWPQAKIEIVHFSSELLSAFGSGIASSSQPLVYLTFATLVLNIALTFRLFWLRRKPQK